MIKLNFDVEELTAEELQAIGEKWLLRLPKGKEKTYGRAYLYKPSQNRTKSLYGNSSNGRAGVVEVLLEIVANVFIYEHGKAQLEENLKARWEKRNAQIIPFKNLHIIPKAEIITYNPYGVEVA